MCLHLSTSNSLLTVLFVVLVFLLYCSSCSHFLSLPLHLVAKIPNGPILFNLLYIYLYYSFLTTPLNTASQCVLGPSAPRAHGIRILPGAAVFTACERRTQERRRENRREAAAAFLCLLDVTIMEICIREKRHSGPLGPKKYKYFNNKHFQCLPPVTAPGYHFTLNAASQHWILYA